MNQEPEKVELLEHGRVTARLSASHKSLNGHQQYTGRATSARIHGRARSVVTFFDDQQFRTGENAVNIVTLVDGPVEIPLAKDFVVDGKEAGGGMHEGETPTYKWKLYKAVKASWLDRNVPMNWEDLERRAQQDGGTWEKGIASAKRLLFGSSTSNNYRVDNCSSVRFGG